MQQFDINMFRAVLALPDEQLWQTIKGIAKQNGVRLPDGTPPREELARLRSVLGASKPDMNEALKIVEKYKKNNGV